MKLSIFQPPGKDYIRIRARAEAPGTIGMMTQILREGQSFMGWSYDELLAMAPAFCDLQPKGLSPVTKPV